MAIDDRASFAVAHAKYMHSPEELTADDFEALGAVDAALLTKAQNARREKLRSMIPVRTTPSLEVAADGGMFRATRNGDGTYGTMGDVAHWDTALRIMKDTPATLSETDLRALWVLDPAMAMKAVEAQQLALRPPDPSPTLPATPAPAAQASAAHMFELADFESDDATELPPAVDDDDALPAAAYDGKRFDRAHWRFLFKPKALTEADLDQLALIDRNLGDRARAKRAGFVAAPDKAVDQMKKFPVSHKYFFQWWRDVHLPILSTFRHVSRKTVARVDALEQRSESGSATRIAELEARLLQLEQRATLKYAGVWETGISYVAGDVVTRSGSAWVCRAAHAADGFDHDLWRLLVKRGVDGRDGKDVK